MNGYRTNSFKNRLIRNGGQKVFILWSAAWWEEDGVVIADGRDVTDQELARQKDELHKAMVEHGSDLLALFDEELTCLYAGSTSKALGCLPEELIGANALNYIHPEDIQMVKNSLSMVLASGGFVRTSDFRFKDADGKWRWVETTLSNQKPIVVLLNEDIKAITKKWGQNRLHLLSIILPVLDVAMDEKEKYQKTRNFTRFVNQHMKTVAKEAGIRAGTITYWARHTFTTTIIVKVPLLKWLPAYWLTKMWQSQNVTGRF